MKFKGTCMCACEWLATYIPKKGITKKWTLGD
jgi:hypothetical protein